MQLIAHYQLEKSEEDFKLISDLYKKCFGKIWESSSVRETFAIYGTHALTSDNGLCVFRIAADEAEIFYMGVAETARRQGVASEMLREMIKFLKEKEVKKIFLEVSEENVPGINFYQKSGFETIGRRPDYYDEGGKKIAALNMKLELE